MFVSRVLLFLSAIPLINGFSPVPQSGELGSIPDELGGFPNAEGNPCLLENAEGKRTGHYCDANCASGVCCQAPMSQPLCQEMGSTCAAGHARWPVCGEGGIVQCDTSHDCFETEFCPPASNPFELPGGKCAQRLAEDSPCWGFDACAVGLTCSYDRNYASCVKTDTTTTATIGSI
eukprot:CAMPEP_0119307212 /NCGR_PEP_ID=MMETSP1333-20130426/7773_1 /TAXON_ID=418940 /ORGANISM="Scyphosphaera apsteinii, Strain RCC1455" /LENGTH=175 /DNA_ID=CAMNT_0007310703 /DNA_START=27 /DNA_END=554 /DNA_ORIENTATION=+